MPRPFNPLTNQSTSGNSGSGAATASSVIAATTFSDEFLTGGGSAAITTATALNFDTGWAAVQISGGTQSILGTSGSFVNPGVVVMTTSAVSGQGVSLYRGGGANNAAPYGILGNNAGWYQDVWFQTGATITSYAIRVGFCSGTNQAADAPTNGFFLEYDTANTGNSDTQFVLRTINSSTSAYDASGVVPAISTWYHLRMFCSTAGTISYQIGTANGALSTARNVTSQVNTTSTMIYFTQVIARTTAARTLSVDKVAYTANTSRV